MKLLQNADWLLHNKVIVPKRVIALYTTVLTDAYKYIHDPVLTCAGTRHSGPAPGAKLFRRFAPNSAPNACHRPRLRRRLRPLMHKEGRLPVRAAAEVPQPNVKRTAGGGFATLLSGFSAPCGRIGRRLQRIGCLFHLGMPGWDWDQWRTWRRPRQRGEHRAYHASVESSLQPGHYTDVVVLYPELDDKKDKKDRAHIRHAAKLLCNTHRSVRHEDGSVGKMVGAGDHLSYYGLVEVR